MLAALSSHRPDTVGGDECVPRGARVLLHARSNAEENSGGKGLEVGFLRGICSLSFVSLPRQSPFMLIARAGSADVRPSTQGASKNV